MHVADAQYNAFQIEKTSELRTKSNKSTSIQFYLSKRKVLVVQENSVSKCAIGHLVGVLLLLT